MFFFGAKNWIQRLKIWSIICAQIFCCGGICAERLGKNSYKKNTTNPTKYSKKASYWTQQCNTRASLNWRSSTQRVMLICKSSLSFPFGLAHVLLLLICGNLFASREKSRILTRQIIQLSNHSLAWFICLIRFQSYCGTSYGLRFNYEFGLFGG